MNPTDLVAALSISGVVHDFGPIGQEKDGARILLILERACSPT